MQPAVGDPPDDLQRSLPTPNIPWFCDMTEMTVFKAWHRSMHRVTLKETFRSQPRSVTYLNKSLNIVLNFVVWSFGAWHLTSPLNYCYLHFTSESTEVQIWGKHHCLNGLNVLRAAPHNFQKHWESLSPSEPKRRPADGAALKCKASAPAELLQEILVSWSQPLPQPQVEFLLPEVHIYSLLMVVFH